VKLSWGGAARAEDGKQYYDNVEMDIDGDVMWVQVGDCCLLANNNPDLPPYVGEITALWTLDGSASCEVCNH
jgi:hypothetical protein